MSVYIPLSFVEHSLEYEMPVLNLIAKILFEFFKSTFVNLYEDILIHNV